MTKKVVSEYAVLPNGTKVEWLKTPPSTFVELTTIEGIGQLGEVTGFSENTPLRSIRKQYITDLKDSEDKSLVFIDDPADVEQTAFLEEAAANKTVTLKMTLPNKRVNTCVLVLAGWRTEEIKSGDSKAIRVVVPAKQNSSDWTTAT